MKKTRIARNGLNAKSVRILFPEITTFHIYENEIELVADDPIVFPSDEAVDAALIEQKWDVIRDKRAPLLIEADWLVQRAEDQGVGVSEARTYRQALRDVTKQPDPENVIWPVKP